MRRKDKEIQDQEEIKEIVQKAKVMRLGLSDNNIPYVIPLNYGFKDGCIYFHSAPEGKKLEILKANNNICFEMDIDHELVEGKKPCASTMHFKSVIGFGKAVLIEDNEKKIEALNIIINHYSPGEPHEFRERQLNRLTTFRIDIKEMTGKKSI